MTKLVRSLGPIILIFQLACAGGNSTATSTDSEKSLGPRAATSLPPWMSFYQARYNLPDIYGKLVDNNGDGFDALYGVRNFRQVLPGLVYRGGANNAYNKYGVRANENPLPDMGLTDLCQEGFTTAIYLYTTNYSTAPASVNCTSIRQGGGHLDYLDHEGVDNDQAHTVLQLVYNLIMGNGTGPIYIHCWNGWHVSGIVSAKILMQFCGFTTTQAVTYWNTDTDGDDVGPEYDNDRAMIKAFVPDPALNISPSLQQALCPSPPAGP